MSNPERSSVWDSASPEALAKLDMAEVEAAEERNKRNPNYTAFPIAVVEIERKETE